jgi:murein DD-endopeptidase MepM/ murein hydrolase activator NlpD
MQRIAPLALLALLIVATTARTARADCLFRHPLDACGDGCSVVTTYFDHGGSRDWACGSLTTPDHEGTDFALIGDFTAQDQGRDVVAAADGIVVATHDGEFDRCRTGDCGGDNGLGNFVIIAHSDHSASVYGHLRNGSLVVAPGEHVTCGRVIAQVGSSGHSTGPHLHFEWRVDGRPRDPFATTVDCGTSTSQWSDQGVYRQHPSTRCTDCPEAAGLTFDAGIDAPASALVRAGGGCTIRPFSARRASGISFVMLIVSCVVMRRLPRIREGIR